MTIQILSAMGPKTGLVGGSIISLLYLSLFKFLIYIIFFITMFLSIVLSFTVRCGIIMTFIIFFIYHIIFRTFPLLLLRNNFRFSALLCAVLFSSTLLTYSFLFFISDCRLLFYPSTFTTPHVRTLSNSLYPTVLHLGANVCLWRDLAV